ncbi:hypothetical protein [Dyella sp. 20L07]|uniref:hypothetical protein n=1 Tax=Dyella sp. 20L07 TaxID=3384240 RepID=UPI003D270963
MRRIFCFLLLAILCTGVSAATIEKPTYAMFKDTPIESNPLMSYVQFGQLQDGSPAVQKIDVSTVRFYERLILFRPNLDKDFYLAEELNCRTGILSFLGMGYLERITALDNPPAPASIKSMNPKNLPVYREVCTSVGIRAAW